MHNSNHQQPLGSAHRRCFLSPCQLHRVQCNSQQEKRQRRMEKKVLLYLRDYFLGGFHQEATHPLPHCLHTRGSDVPEAVQDSGQKVSRLRWRDVFANGLERSQEQKRLHHSSAPAMRQGQEAGQDCQCGSHGGGEGLILPLCTQCCLHLMQPTDVEASPPVLFAYRPQLCSDKSTHSLTHTHTHRGSAPACLKGSPAPKPPPAC